MAEDEEKTNEDNPEGTETNSTDSLFDKTNAATDRLEAANKEKKELLEREETLYAKKKLGGQSEGEEKPEPPKKLTDTEYAEALQRGEVNPLKEDGLI